MRSYDRCLYGFFVAGFVVAGCGGDQAGSSALRTWRAQGPAPILGGEVEIGAQQDPVAGAVNVVLPHPNNPDRLYVATVNGGVWRTDNATAASGPSWAPLTDDQASLSIGALAFDAADHEYRTLVAGIGHRSAFRRTQSDASGYLPGFGGPLTGVLVSTDGGDSWSARGAEDLAGRNIVAIAARGDALLAGADQLAAAPGLYRSTDGGRHFALVSGAPGSGLPLGAVTDIAGDPEMPGRHYAAVLTAGIFRSDDDGATWSDVTDPRCAALFDSSTQNVKVSVHHGTAANAVYVGIASNGVGAAGFFRFAAPDGAWTDLGVPQTVESGIPFGLITETDNGSGVIHFSLEADRVDPNIVYVGGDAQPSGDGNQLPIPEWPNSIGSVNYVGRLFRGDASQPIGRVWTPLTDDFARLPGGPVTAPHADSRDMAFDARGNLVEGDDGGVFTRGRPRSTEGTWSSLIGDLQISELHSIAWDHNTHTIIAGAQDVGVPEQAASGGRTWRTVVQCDGGKVAVDASQPGTSIRYSSIYLLQLSERRLVNAQNQVVDTQVPAFIVDGTGQSITVVDPTLQFYTPLVLNRIQPDRMLVGSSNLYESFDRGDTLHEIVDLGAPTGGTTFGVPMVYGGRRDSLDNPDVLYVGAGSRIFHRAEGGGRPVALPDYPGGDAADIALSPEDWAIAYVVDDRDVYRTRDAGRTWDVITGNLAVRELQAVAVIPSDAGDRIAVSGVTGVSVASAARPTAWAPFGEGLPNAVVMDLVYDAADDVLVAGTLGRGAWVLDEASAP